MHEKYFGIAQVYQSYDAELAQSSKQFSNRNNVASGENG